MDQTALNNHYKNLAEKYDASYSTFDVAEGSEAKYDFAGESGAKVIIELLGLKTDDRLVDLGAGTCKTAGMVATLAGLGGS